MVAGSRADGALPCPPLGSYTFAAGSIPAAVIVAASAPIVFPLKDVSKYIEAFPGIVRLSAPVLKGTKKLPHF